MIALLTLTLSAAAAELHLIRKGETVESISEARGLDPAAVRTLNKLAAGAQPEVGALIELPAPTGDHGEQKAFLIALRGKGTFETSNGKKSPAVTWQPVESGTTICTGENSYATLRLASTCTNDGSEVDDLALSSDTCVVVESAFSSANGRSSVVSVSQGSVAVQHAPEGAGNITLRTAAGNTTGDEGGFRVTVEENAARTEALYGEAVVQGAGAEVDLNAGQGSRTVEGEAPGPAVDLLETGPLTRPGDGEALRKPEFTWEAVEDAFGYRLEIAADKDFREILFAEDTPEPSYAAPILMLPVARVPALYWRVSSFDRLGFMGIPTPPSRLTFPTGVNR